MPGIAADLDGLAQLDLADALLEVTENSQQFFRRAERAVLVSAQTERGVDEFLEFRAHKRDLPS